MNCVLSELQGVEDRSINRYVSEFIPKKEIQQLILSFCRQGESVFKKEKNGTEEIASYIESNEFYDRSAHRDTLRGQEKKKKEKEDEEEKMVHSTRVNLLSEEGIIGRNCCVSDNNGFGFGFGNVVTREKLLGVFACSLER